MTQGKRKAKSLPASRRPSPNLIGIGIDLLSLKRSRDLLQRHGSAFFTRILSPREKRLKPTCSTTQLARYFTAKEAFFKSSGMAWTDLKGFSGMWIETIKGKNFRMGCWNSKIQGKGEFFKRNGLWGAKVEVWQIHN